MKSERFRFLARGAVLALTYGAIGAACAMADEMAPVPEIQPGVLAGYLPRAALPDSVALLPPPPAEGSAALAMDHEISQGYLVLEGSPRW